MIVLYFPKPYQFFRCADQLLIELIEAAITDQCDDGLQGAMDSQHIASMLNLNCSSHRSEGRKVIQVTIRCPDSG